MSLRARPRNNPKLRRLEEECIESLVERVFGYGDGPLFDRSKVSPTLLDEFARRSEVRDATWEFALEIMQLWAARHPGRPLLYPAGRRPVGPARSDSQQPRQPTSSSDQAAQGSTMNPDSDKAPIGSAPIHAGAKAGAIPAAAPIGSSPPAERPVSFFVPNARSGEAYRAVVAGKDDQGKPVSVTDAKLPAELGLTFDAATGALHGTPTQAGEHLVTLRWHDERGGTRSGSLVVIVNANPRELWKTIDADASDAYFKPNEDSRCIEASGRRIAAGSKRGRSHAHAGTCRDDDFVIEHDAASGWSTLVVADGAGSAKSSRKGAALAVEKAGGHLASELAGSEGAQLDRLIADWERDGGAGARPLKDSLYNLFGKAAWAALRAIEDEATAKAAPVKDYSTTLLCAVHRSVPSGVFVASFWLGDGAICAFGPGGSARLMGKPDSGEFAGQTRFLDRAALSDSTSLWTRIEFSRHDALTALILMTDGISDPRFETDNGLADVSKWERLWTELAPALAAPAPEKALVEWMDFFTPGHHDDRTIALLW